MVTVVWVKRAGKKEIWHACEDPWDTDTFCGLPIRLKSEYLLNPSGERCNACQTKVSTTDKSTD